jgi:RimJ/RimL family protein N-acetyltransferase
MTGENLRGTAPVEISTAMAGLVLRQMITIDNDQVHLDYMQKNQAHLAEFGNTVDENLEAATKRRLESGNGLFGIWFGDQLVGTTQYQTDITDAEEAEIGISLDKDATGHGYATEALKALTEYAKTLFGRVYAEIDVNNANSIRLFTRAGYQTNAQVVKRKWGDALTFEAPK